MPRKRRIIRKIYPETQQWFGEQMWPLVVAMFVLGGFLAGTVLAYLRVDTPYWYANAWTWLIAIPLVIAAALIGLAYTGNRLLRRTMQLALIVCMIFHLALFIAAIETDVFRRVWMEVIADTEQVPEKRVVKVPVYSSLQHNPKEYAASDFAQPVATDLPEPEPGRVQRERLEHPPETADPQPIIEPQPSVKPNLKRRQNPSRVIPRQNQQASQLSRKSGVLPPAPNQEIQIPNMPVRRSRRPTSEPADATVKRQNAPATVNRQPPSQSLPEISQQSRPPQLARRAADTQPRPESPSTTSLARRLDRPAELPRTDVRSRSRPSASGQTRATAVRPSPTLAQRQRTQAPEVEPLVNDPIRQLSPQVAPRTRMPQQPVAEQPTLARAPGSVDRRQPRLTDRPAGPTSVATTPAQPTSQQNAPTIAAAATSVGKSEPTSGPVGTTTQRQAPNDNPSVANQIAANRPRATTASQPQVSNPVNIETAPRTIRVTRRDESTTTADQPPNRRPAARNPSRQPAATRLAITKSNAGTAGSGSRQNLGKRNPAPDKPATVASDSAKRAESSQAMPKGPALAPRDRALVRRDQAGRSQPSATLRATELTPTHLPGDREPAELYASATASATRAASDATRGPITAAKGSTDVDLGPTTIVSGLSNGQAAGGGQPEPSGGGQQQIARRENLVSNVSPSAAARSIAQVAEMNPTSQPVEPSDEAATAPGGLAKRTAPGQPPTAEPANRMSVSSVAVTQPGTDSALPRAEAAQSLAGPVESGGGNGLARTMDRGPRIQVTSQAESVAVAGAPISSDVDPSDLANAVDVQQSRRMQGIVADNKSAPVGAEAANMLAEVPNGTEPGLGQMDREISPSDQAGPMIRDLAQSGGPGKRLLELRFSSPAPQVAVPAAAGQADPAAMPIEETGLATRQPQAGPVRRSSGDSLPVDLTADQGPGGLGDTISPEVGLARRRATDDSPQLQLETFRFTRRDASGLPDISAVTPMATEPYRRRAERAAGMGSQENSPGPQTEEAIELGLVFLSQCQADDGAWRLDHFAPADGLPQMASDTAATGLAVLAFQGAGYHHRSFRYAEAVKRGIEFLVQNQQEDGCLFIPMDPASNRVVEFYSHGIAALALSEAYGMTQDPELREPAQKALDYIVKTQHPDRGGWRYTPQIGSDTSVTGWMVMALKSGELAELQVPPRTYAGIRDWLDQARASASQPYLFCYNPFAPDTTAQRLGRRPSTTMTSVGLLMQLYLGWKRNHPQMSQGADVLLDSLPAVGTPTNPQRDTYYWYYATQVMFHMGGQYWESWNNKLHPLLINTQIRQGEMAGSWDPNLPVRDRWAPHAGRIYVTAMNLLSLEVTYRYLPLYEETGR